ncbi:TPA: phage tail spike protein [Streptococcus suis]
MLLTIHDMNLRQVASIDNDKQDALNYINDKWTRYMETGSSTFEFTVFKRSLKKDTGSKHAYHYLNNKAFVSFEYEGEVQLFKVRKIVENEKTITCSCVNLNLELINEYANPFKSEQPKTFKEYCEAMDLLNFTLLTIGVNEISDKRIKAEWTGQDTKLARLLSLANKFGAELEFKTYLNDDSSIKSFVVNIYHENDDTHHGVGRIHAKPLRYGKDFKSLIRTVDNTNIYNAVRPTGKAENGDIVTIGGMEAWSVNNEYGEREFYQQGELLYAPLSMQMFPSAFTSSTMADQWIRKDITVDSADKKVIRATAYRELKKHAYPDVSYEVEGFIDRGIGDTVFVYDDGFVPTLLLRMRVVEQEISSTNPSSNRTRFANFKTLDNLLPDDLQKRIDELFEASQPYLIKLATDNGVIFKNGTGQSIVTPTLYKGGRPITANVTWRWSLDGAVKTGMTYTVRGADVTDTSTLTIAAYIGNDEVAVDELTFVNVLDGRDGTKGEKGDPGQRGADGLPGRDGVGIRSTTVTYASSTNGATAPTTGWTVAVPTVAPGNYLWTKTVWTYTDGNTETGYNVSRIGRDGNTGRDGIAGKDGVGIRSTTITYGKSTSGTIQPTSWASQVPSVPNGQFLWTKTVWAYTDNTSETGYSVAKMGETGPKGEQGIPGEKGADGRTQYTHIAYADNATGGGFSQTDQSKAYIGMYQDFNAANSTNPASYRWSPWKGKDGKDGVPGPKGADGRTPYIHWAYSDNADGTGLTTSDNGQRYIGHYSDYTQADSTDKTKYRWADRWAKIEVGGRNILRNATFSNPKERSETFTVGGTTYKNIEIPNWGSMYNSGITNPTISYHAFYRESFNGTGPVIEFNESNGQRNWKALNQALQASDLRVGKYTFSADIFATGVGTKIQFGIYYYNKAGQRDFHSGKTTINISTINKWHRVSGNLKLNDDIDFTKEIRFYIYSFEFTTNSILYLTKPQLEEGTVATTFGEAQADVDKRIDSKADQALTQEQLNSLNERAGIIQAELEAKASLDTVNNILKQIKDMKVADEATWAKVEKDLITHLQRVIKIETNLGDQAQRWNAVDTFMQVSNDGLSLGKADGSSSMLFSPDGRITMFSSGTPVMYVDKGVIHIDNGIFSKTVQIGRFIEEQYHNNPDINVKLYVGGS